MSSEVKFTVKNFFNELIFHPDHAKKGKDRDKAWAATILFGVCTLAFGPALVGLYHLGRYAFKQWNIKKKGEEDLTPVDKRVKDLPQVQNVTTQRNAVEVEKQQDKFTKAGGTKTEPELPSQRNLPEP